MKERGYYLKHQAETITPIRFENRISKKTQDKILTNMWEAEKLLQERFCFAYNPRCVADYALTEPEFSKDKPKFLVVPNPFIPYALLAGSMTFEQVIKEREQICQKNPYSVSIMFSVEDFMSQVHLNSTIKPVYRKVNFPIKNPLLTIDFTYLLIKDFSKVIKHFKIDNSTVVKFYFSPVEINSLTCLAEMPFLTSLQIFNKGEEYKFTLKNERNKIRKIINPVPAWSDKYGVDINIDKDGWIVLNSI